MTKQKSNRLGMYSDVRDILDAALAAGGGTMLCESYGAAVHWRQRAYRFRKLYAETLGPKTESPYDTLVLHGLKQDETSVRISIRQPGGVFQPLINKTPAEDEFEEAARRLFAKLGGNNDTD